jgi:hypothetical protein
MDDRRSLCELPRREALDLLASTPVGRVVFTGRALPAIRPDVVTGFRLTADAA